MTRRTLFLIIGLIFIILSIVIILLLRSSKPGENPIVVFNPTPTPTAAFNVGDFVLTNIDPASDPTGKSKFSPISRVTFTFNKIINTSSLKITSTPEIELDTIYSEGFTKLTIQPKGLAFWKPFTVYTIKIQAGLKAEDGTSLKQDIIYQLQAVTLGGE